MVFNKNKSFQLHFGICYVEEGWWKTQRATLWYKELYNYFLYAGFIAYYVIIFFHFILESLCIKWCTFHKTLKYFFRYTSCLCGLKINGRCTSRLIPTRVITVPNVAYFVLTQSDTYQRKWRHELIVEHTVKSLPVL